MQECFAVTLNTAARQTQEPPRGRAKMSKDHLLAKRNGPILEVVLNRPEKLNAISAEMFARLYEEVESFRDEPDLRVMLIRSTGRYFCAGVEMLEGQKRPSDVDTGSEIRELHRIGVGGIRRLFDEIEAIEKPFVAAHHATCIGGGLELSLACDFRLASESASYSFPESSFGCLPASGGVSRLTRIVGVHWARYLIMANLPVTAQQALNIGLVHEVHPSDQFDQHVNQFCRHLAELPAEVTGMAKLAIEMAADLEARQAQNLERLANSALMLDPNYKQLVRNHRQKLSKKKQNNNE